MPEEMWKKLIEVAGELEAEIIKSMLEANDISVQTIQEGAGRAYGLSIGPLGTVELYVPPQKFADAQKLLDRYYSMSDDDSGE